MLSTNHANSEGLKSYHEGCNFALCIHYNSAILEELYKNCLDNMEFDPKVEKVRVYFMYCTH